MIVAIIVLSVLVFLLCVALLLCAFKLFDLNAQCQLFTQLLSAKEESICRVQCLIYEKFGYHVPASDKYLSLAELMHKETKVSQGGE